jgi:hypothetical protein
MGFQLSPNTTEKVSGEQRANTYEEGLSKGVEGRRAGGMMEVESKEDMWLTVIRFKQPRIIRGQCKILEIFTLREFAVTSVLST